MQPAELDLLMPKGHNHGRDQPSTCIEVDHEVDMHHHAGNEVMVVLTTTQESLSLCQAQRVPLEHAPVGDLMQILDETTSVT